MNTALTLPRYEHSVATIPSSQVSSDNTTPSNECRHDYKCFRLKIVVRRKTRCKHSRERKAFSRNCHITLYLLIFILNSYFLFLHDIIRCHTNILLPCILNVLKCKIISLRKTTFTSMTSSLQQTRQTFQQTSADAVC